MKKLIIAALVLVGLTCQAQKANEKETVVVIKTSMGTIKAKLYNDTPQHRDNFIKLVNEGWYNGSPFHRVIKDFMIQGGQNKDGRLDPGYRVPAEFKDNHFVGRTKTVASIRVIESLPKSRTTTSTRKEPFVPPVSLIRLIPRRPPVVRSSTSCKARCTTTRLWTCLKAVWAKCSMLANARPIRPWVARPILMVNTPCSAK